LNTTKYDKKTVLITGGSSGMGFATAKLLADDGARVIITGRRTTTLDSAIRHIGPRAVGLASDAASMADIAALADRVKEQFGELDGLFLNAGINGVAPFESTPEQLYDQVLTINAKGTYFTAQKLVPPPQRR
jgi:NAD(P)-dependent dehydrogenase (short-subunit alcohol dehydrogenase family)